MKVKLLRKIRKRYKIVYNGRSWAGESWSIIDIQNKRVVTDHVVGFKFAILRAIDETIGYSFRSALENERHRRRRRRQELKQYKYLLKRSEKKI